jgi:hypothetical protein
MKEMPLLSKAEQAQYDEYLEHLMQMKAGDPPHAHKFCGMKPQHHSQAEESAE